MGDGRGGEDGRSAGLVSCERSWLAAQWSSKSAAGATRADCSLTELWACGTPQPAMAVWCAVVLRPEANRATGPPTVRLRWVTPPPIHHSGSFGSAGCLAWQGESGLGVHRVRRVRWLRTTTLDARLLAGRSGRSLQWYDIHRRSPCRLNLCLLLHPALPLSFLASQHLSLYLSLSHLTPTPFP